jgi:hypothetical protein
MQCANCQNVSHFSDNFNGGIDPAIWVIEGKWSHDNENHSIRSDVRCREHANISLNKKFVGPCRVSFSWKISRGHNKFTLYDNDNETLYKLPDYYIDDSRRHESIDWTEVTFNLSDRSEHNLKWVHENPFKYVLENPYDIGTVWLDNIQIISSIPPSFENFIEPTDAICLFDSVNDVISDSTISSEFNYSVESSSDNLALFILPPNSSAPLGPFYPNMKNQTSRDMYKFEWSNLKLECGEIGDYIYWFASDDGYLSPTKVNPRIITLVKEESADTYDVDYTNQTYRTKYGILISSSRNWKISLIVPDRSQLDSTQTYLAGSGFRNLIWDHKWNFSEEKPNLKFYLN